MSSISTSAGVKKVEVEAVVIRADGTREVLGTIAYWHRNPIARLFWRLFKRT